jgi:DNA-binding NarL/FixJ family response regulator
LIGLYISQAVLQALDAQSSIRALQTGSAQEGNPLVHPLASQPAALVIFKLAMTAGTIYGIDRLHKSHPRLAIITLGAISAGYLYLVQRNYRSFPAR